MRTKLRQIIRERGIGNSMTSARPDPFGSPVGCVSRPDELLVHASTSLILQDCRKYLDAFAPGYHWVLQANEFGQVVNLFCADFSLRWGYVIKMPDIINDPHRRFIVRAAQEILSRFGVSRTYNAEAVAMVPTRNGEAIPITSGMRHTKQVLAAELHLAMATGKGRRIGGDGCGSIIEIHS